MTSHEAAKAYIDILHGGDARSAFRTAKKRDCRPEPFSPSMIYDQKESPVWVAASCDLQGVHVSGSGGEAVLVTWHELYPIDTLAKH